MIHIQMYLPWMIHKWWWGSSRYILYHTEGTLWCYLLCWDHILLG